MIIMFVINFKWVSWPLFKNRLVDNFERFHSTCLEYYGLGPSHYFSLPGLSWDAMLKMTVTELKKVFFCISKGCGKANNKYMLSYDNKKFK